MVAVATLAAGRVVASPAPATLRKRGEPPSFRSAIRRISRFGSTAATFEAPLDPLRGEVAGPGPDVRHGRRRDDSCGGDDSVDRGIGVGGASAIVGLGPTGEPPFACRTRALRAPVLHVAGTILLWSHEVGDAVAEVEVIAEATEVDRGAHAVRRRDHEGYAEIDAGRYAGLDRERTVERLHRARLGLGRRVGASDPDDEVEVAREGRRKPAADRALVDGEVRPRESPAAERPGCRRGRWCRACPNRRRSRTRAPGA